MLCGSYGSVSMGVCRYMYVPGILRWVDRYLHVFNVHTLYSKGYKDACRSCMFIEKSVYFLKHFAKCCVKERPRETERHETFEWSSIHPIRTKSESTDGSIDDVVYIHPSGYTRPKSAWWNLQTVFCLLERRVFFLLSSFFFFFFI